MSTTKEERHRYVANMLANFRLEGGLPDAEHIALLDRYIEGTATLVDLFNHAYEYVTTAQEREDARRVSAELLRLNEEYVASGRAYDEERKRRALSNIGLSSDQRKRQEALDFARASVELSGFRVSEACEQAATRYVLGEISIQEWVALLTKGV